jgi:general secretion pathway protein B
MSFILDALRKSDSERQQQAAPSLASKVQRNEPRRQKFWIPLLVAVLGLNAVLGWFLLRDDEPTANEASPVETATRSLRKESAPLPNQPPTQPSDRTPADDPVANPAPVQVAVPAPVDTERSTITELPATIPTAAPPRSRTPPASPPPNEANLPNFERVLSAGIISSPPLHLDIHVFAPESAKRFVFVNMKKYREGEQLEEGPVIEAITETGVILSQNGSRFTLESN